MAEANSPKYLSLKYKLHTGYIKSWWCVFESHFACVGAPVKTLERLSAWHLETKWNLLFTKKNVLFILISFFLSLSLLIPQLSLEFQVPELVYTVSLFEVHVREVVSWSSKLLSTFTFLSFLLCVSTDRSPSDQLKHNWIKMLQKMSF